MFSLVLTQKWWLGLVAGVFGVLGVGTTLVAIPAFADAGRSFNAASPDGVEVRLECKKGTWAPGTFTWTVTGATPVTVLPACPKERRRTITVPVTMPATGVATPDGFRIRVSGKSNSGDTTAECTFPSPNLGSREMRRQHLTFTCAADGATSNQQAHMKIKVRWSERDDDDGRGSQSSNKSKSQDSSDDRNDDSRGRGRSDDKDDKEKNEGKGENRGRGRGR